MTVAPLPGAAPSRHSVAAPATAMVPVGGSRSLAHRALGGREGTQTMPVPVPRQRAIPAVESGQAQAVLTRPLRRDRGPARTAPADTPDAGTDLS